MVVVKGASVVVVVVIDFVVGASGTLVWTLVVGMLVKPKQNTNIVKYISYKNGYIRHIF